jgi:hypothetical protein
LQESHTYLALVTIQQKNKPDVEECSFARKLTK